MVKPSPPGTDSCDKEATKAALTGQVAAHGGVQRGHLEEAQRLVDVALGSEGKQLHLGEALGDADDGLQLAHGDGDGAAALLLVLARPGPHHHVAPLQLLAGLGVQPGATTPVNRFNYTKNKVFCC